MPKVCSLRAASKALWIYVYEMGGAGSYSITDCGIVLNKHHVNALVCIFRLVYTVLQRNGLAGLLMNAVELNPSHSTSVHSPESTRLLVRKSYTKLAPMSFII